MNVTRDVILDLIPLYLANELSEDSRALVDAFLAEDVQLAKLVERAAQEELPTEIPALSEEIEMKTFLKTKRLLRQQNIFLFAAIFASLSFVAFRFDGEGVQWLWRNSPEIGWPLFLLAIIFWTAYLNVCYQLNKSE